MIQTSNRKYLLDLFKRRSKAHQRNMLQESVLNFDQWETLSENYKPIIANCNCNCSLRYFVKIIQTQKRYPTSLDKISILTWMLIVISSQNFSYKLNFENFPAGVYMFKVNNRKTRTRYKICSKLTIKTPKRWCCSSFIVYLEHILYHALVFLLLTLSR